MRGAIHAGYGPSSMAPMREVSSMRSIRPYSGAPARVSCGQRADLCAGVSSMGKRSSKRAVIDELAGAGGHEGVVARLGRQGRSAPCHLWNLCATHARKSLCAQCIGHSDARGTRPGLRELWQARNPYRLDQAAAQFSNTNPGMSEKSAVLLVTRTNPVLIACAAIIRSKSRPLVQPHCAMILP
jgi:hypothetical protein